MRTHHSTTKSFSTTRPAMWIGVPLSITVGLALYVMTAGSIEADSRQRFSAHAQNARNIIVARIKSYTDVLRGTASLFQTSYPLTRRQFHGYVQGLELARHFPAIETINFAEFVKDENREAFERRIRSELNADIDGVTRFEIRPPGRRAEYSVLTFIEPIEPGNKAIGFDLQANPLQQVNHVALRDGGQLISSGMPVAAMSGRNRTGLAMRLPIYLPHAPTSTVKERRAAFVGSVGIAFSVDKLVLGVIDEMPVKNVRMTLVDNAIGVDRKRGRVLFDTQPGLAARRTGVNLLSDRFSSTLPIDFNGRQWDATFSIAARDLYTGFEEFVPWLAMAAGFTSSMLLYALFHALTSSRRRAIKMAKGMTRELRESQTKLQQSHQNLRRLAAHADQIKEGERKRIAREIHDDLGQNLLALRIEADMLATRTRDKHPRLHARARGTLQQIDATIKSVRQIINDLRPNVLDLGLSAAVEWQIAEFRRRTGIACELIDEPKDVTLNDHAATAFFRILQESLSNIVRHAHATAVRVQLCSDGRQLTMTVTDNGIGLGARERGKAGSFGLVGIEERISILGGSCSISSADGEGTTVCVSVPLQEPGRDASSPPAGPSSRHPALV
ncbi:CHASE domain-containing protein [Massilia sp. PAMC28688]|uniref:sensor histidine kinase n=1 Tax=Massilia sp. PAMC28688 TaxID=2861283 RepID=UPI001E38644C|nr:CHASE domain-containing protein [Massilia sp. PAMC28688]